MPRACGMGRNTRRPRSNSLYIMHPIALRITLFLDLFVVFTYLVSSGLKPPWRHIYGNEAVQVGESTVKSVSGIPKKAAISTQDDISMIRCAMHVSSSGS